MTCNPRNIIKPSQATERIRYRSGDTDDIITVIMDMDAKADKSIDPNEVECLRGRDGYETMHNVWRFVKQNVRYKPDARGKEKVKSPAALFRVGTGDCKSFSIAEVALLRALGFTNIRYRFTAYTPGGDVTHVYVVCRYAGRDVIMDAVHSRFDEEVPYSWKMDKKAATGINGISGISPVGIGTPFTHILSYGLIGWGLYKLLK